jgi:2-dehydro-3-deoxyphosphooctonate aldolase (KDO 8-P synthase)
MEVADALVTACAQVHFQPVFKASYDKANRTSPKSFRGPGLRRGLKVLQKVRDRFNIPVLTDVHAPEEVPLVAEVCEILQIPAFLCRQTDLLVAAGRSGRVVNVKKGQFLAPQDVQGIAAKLRSARCKNFFITERGTTFGYHDLVVDMRGLAQMRQAGMRVIFDATHSVQRPGGLGDATGGDRTLAPVLARSATAAGIDGLFLEMHPDPDKALSDGPNQVRLEDVSALLQMIQRIDQAVKRDESATI